MGEFKRVRTARRTHLCETYRSGHSIEKGERYLFASLPPSDPDNSSERWWTIKVCGRCLSTDEDMALVEGVAVEELIQRRRDDVAAWNERHPVGTPVRYWPMDRIGAGVESTTRTPAWLMTGKSHPVVSVEGCAGGISLTHVEVRESAPVPVPVPVPVPAPDAHVPYVPGEDPGIAALREMVNDNRGWLGIDGDGGGEGR